MNAKGQQLIMSNSTDDIEVNQRIHAKEQEGIDNGNTLSMPADSGIDAESQRLLSEIEEAGISFNDVVNAVNNDEPETSQSYSNEEPETSQSYSNEEPETSQSYSNEEPVTSQSYDNQEPVSDTMKSETIPNDGYVKNRNKRIYPPKEIDLTPSELLNAIDWSVGEQLAVYERKYDTSAKRKHNYLIAKIPERPFTTEQLILLIGKSGKFAVRGLTVNESTPFVNSLPFRTLVITPQMLSDARLKEKDYTSTGSSTMSEEERDELAMLRAEKKLRDQGYSPTQTNPIANVNTAGMGDGMQLMIAMMQQQQQQSAQQMSDFREQMREDRKHEREMAREERQREQDRAERDRDRDRQYNDKLVEVTKTQSNPISTQPNPMDQMTKMATLVGELVAIGNPNALEAVEDSTAVKMVRAFTDNASGLGDGVTAIVGAFDTVMKTVRSKKDNNSTPAIQAKKEFDMPSEDESKTLDTVMQDDFDNIDAIMNEREEVIDQAVQS